MDKDPVDPGLCGSGAVVSIVSHTNRVLGLITCWLHFVLSSFVPISGDSGYMSQSEHEQMSVLTKESKYCIYV